MKCKRCGADMVRYKTGAHSFAYKCRKCGYEVKPRATKEEIQEALKEAGRAES